MTIDSNGRSAEGLLTLLQLRGVGALTAIRLAKRFRQLSETTSASFESLRGLAKKPVIDQLRNREAMRVAHDQALRQISEATGQGIQPISYFSSDYPPLLRQIVDPPAVLYVKGLMRPEQPRVACVGTRKPTQFGIDAAKKICTMLVQSGYSILSGLAIGIDGECHRTALNNGGHTVAVLGNGLDSVQPARHRELAERILKQGGALVSEQPLGAKALARNLIQSVRLQSGLSLATFVMQTDLDGGTMHTVRSTLEQQHLLFVPVPARELEEEPANRGILALVRLNGPQLAETLTAKNGFRDLLQRKFRDRPPAWPIRGDEDDAAVRDRLRTAANDCRLHS